jgi:myo-inositol-hexaphosphate 3-phosphohydrolase
MSDAAASRIAVCLYVLAAGVAPPRAAAAVRPLVETTAMYGSGDVADGVCLWVHPTDGARSVVFGANKGEAGGGGLYAFALDGGHAVGDSWQAGVNWFAAGDGINVADVGYGFQAGEQTWDILCAANRTDDTIDVFRVETAPGGDLTGLTKVGAVAPLHLEDDYPYGLAVFHSRSQSRHYVVVSDKDGLCEQLALSYSAATGQVTGTSVWHDDVSGDGVEVEGIVADNDREVVYIASEDTNIYRYTTRDGVIRSAGRVTVDSTAGPRLDADIENMALYYAADGQGYLIASSQGDSEFAVYERDFTGAGANEHVVNFAIEAGNGIDAVTGTDGIYVVSTGLGGDFDDGIFIAHDESGHDPTNFKFVDWADIADEVQPALRVFRGWDPRGVPRPAALHWRPATGNWADSTNWSLGVPMADSTAVFDDDAAIRAVDLEARSRTVHQVRFAGTAGGYDIRNGVLRLAAFDGNSPRIEQSATVAGTNAISARLEAPGLDLVVSGGTLELSGLAEANTIQLGGTLRLSGAEASDCNSLSIGETGLLDLGAGAILIRSGSLAEVMAEVVRGRHGGAWDGQAGITSSAAALDAALAVGLAEEADGIHLAVTLLGDADLSGRVDFLDYLLLKSHLGRGEGNWSGGDFDYDGDVDRLDFLALVENFGRTFGAAPPSAAVPEPTSLVLLSMGLLVLAGGRRRP